MNSFRDPSSVSSSSTLYLAIEYSYGTVNEANIHKVIAQIMSWNDDVNKELRLCLPIMKIQGMAGDGEKDDGLGASL